MAVGLYPAENLKAVAGVSLAAGSAGIYRKKRDDLVLVGIEEGASVTAVFTRNSFAAAPVVIAKRHLTTGPDIRYCLINAGNANAGMGNKGIDDALETCKSVAHYATCPAESILPFSTGVIGMDLPVAKINSAIPGLLASLQPDSWGSCAQAIMTTDTVSKGISRQLSLDGTTVTITGIAKGSGMIRPDMATMLAFIATDAAIPRDLLDTALKEAVSRSFNRICVDGDMSTNDACLLIASGKAGHEPITSNNEKSYCLFLEALEEVCTYLAMAIVRDGEGASKFISINVVSCRDKDECLKIAYSIATSPLVKTAMFACDPNWGRILAAVGYAGIPELDINRVRIDLNDVCIVRNGARAVEYSEEAGVAVMSEDEITITVDLGRGDSEDTVWTCDFSHDYVRINAEYRS